MHTRKVDVVDEMFGTRVSDPYRWLEDGDTDEVKQWTERENQATRALLDPLPGRAALRSEIADLLHVGYVTGPAVLATHGGKRRYFHTKREGEANQPTLYVREGHDGKDRVLLDVSTLSADGTTALDWWYPSWDGALVAWGRSDAGSEESVLHVRDVATGKDLADVIPHTRHASVAWLPNGKEFYYSRYPAAGTVPKGDENYGSKIFHHVLGKDPKDDALVFGDGREKTDVPQVMVSPNGRWLVVRVHEGWDKSEVYLRDLSLGEKGKWIEVAVKAHAVFDPTPKDDRLYILTNDGASRYKLYAVDYAHPERAAWKEVLPEAADVLTDVTFLGHEIVATYLHQASTELKRFTLEGKPKGEIALPALGTATVSGPREGGEAFVDFASYVTPYQVVRYDLASGKSSIWDRVGEKFSAEGVTITRLEATSKDGTKVPMFVVAKEGLVKDGKAPTVLYGYGGFNVNQTPAFSARALTTVRRGGVWVAAVLRGGGEFGEDWHRAGMLEKKQNVFDDYIACAEELVRQKITSPDKLGIMGGSNGGLLVAAAVTQRPELFRVGLSLVPLTDMIRYPKFRIAKLWVPEYGDPEKKDDFAWLYAYSPYHHVKEGTRYPAMLFTSAESDSRVDPMHARKMAARVREAQDAAGATAERPILLRLESKAGHGAGKPTSKLVDELTDEMSFLFHELGVKLD